MAGRGGRVRDYGRGCGNAARRGQQAGCDPGLDLLLFDLGLLDGGSRDQRGQIGLDLRRRLLLGGDGGLGGAAVGVDRVGRGPSRALGALQLIAQGEEIPTGGLETGEGMALVVEGDVDIGAPDAEIGAVG